MSKHNKIKIGQKFISKDGYEVVVVSYYNYNQVVVEDDVGNRRLVSSSDLRRGIKWHNKQGFKKTVRISELEDEHKLKKLKGRKVGAVTRYPKYHYPSGYHVYMAWLMSTGEKLYIGYGKADRYKHCISGKSTNKELNRLYFQGAPMMVEVLAEGLSATEARTLEKILIAKHKPRCNEIIYELSE